MAEEGTTPPIGYPAPKKVLTVLSSVDKFPDESPTGWFLSEAAHPYKVWTEAGFSVDFAAISCDGEEGPAKATVDPASISMAMDSNDKVSIQFNDDQTALTELKKLADLVETAVETYDAIFFCGGFGAMYDFPTNENVKTITKAMYDAGKVVAAVCHGPIALINIEGDGGKLIEGKEVTAFCNAEEDQFGKRAQVEPEAGPGTCEDTMTAAGAFFKAPAEPWAALVVESGNLITGANPASAGPLAQAVVFALDPIKRDFDPPREALLAERGSLVKELEALKAEFTKAIKPLKDSNNVDGMDELQIKSIAARDWNAGLLATCDSKLERLANERQKKIDEMNAAAAAAAAEAEE